MPTPVDLNSVSQGEAGPLVVILHGMLGSSRNWSTIARDLAADHRVFALDLRNHGTSPHTGPFNYADLAADVLRWLDTHVEGPVTLIGHSLGGKTAMRLACRHPERLERLVIVDASPRPVAPRWQQEFRAMRAMDMPSLGTRKDAEDFLEQQGIDDWAFRKFLTSNIERDSDGRYSWKVGLESLQASLPAIFGPVLGPDEEFDGETLLIRGGDSRFVPDADLDAIRRHFPRVRVETIAEAGHNVHADAPQAFLKLVRTFMDGASAPQ